MFVGVCFKEKVRGIMMRLFVARSPVQMGFTKTRTPVMGMVFLWGCGYIRRVKDILEGKRVLKGAMSGLCGG